MALFYVVTNTVLPSGKRAYHVIDARAMTLEELAADLRGGPIVVDKIWTRVLDHTVSEKVHEIYKRDRLVLTSYAVYEITVPTHQYVEYEPPTGA